MMGSVVGHINSSGSITNAYAFWPYRESSGGTRPSGTFQWVGSLGYYADPGTRTYIRAREYEQSIGSWLQLDPLWPEVAQKSKSTARYPSVHGRRAL
jgi:hypothetical protein